MTTPTPPQAEMLWSDSAIDAAAGTLAERWCYSDGAIEKCANDIFGWMVQLRSDYEAALATLRQQLASRDAEIARLKTTIDEFYGIGTPYLDGFSESELERYSQMSPPEMFRHYLDATRERDEALAKLAQASEWQPAPDGIYGEYDTVSISDDGAILFVSSAYGHGQVCRAMLPLPDDIRLCRRVPQEGAE